jgi:hypothetical protein
MDMVLALFAMTCLIQAQMITDEQVELAVKAVQGEEVR